MPISDDQSWARRLMLRGAQEDDEGWSAISGLVEEIAHRAVPGGSRFEACDVVSLVMERLLRFRERDLASVERGGMPMRAVMTRMVRNSLYDLVRFHGRSCRSTAGTLSDQDDEGRESVLSANLAAPVPDEPTLRLWSSLMASDAIQSYTSALQHIHEVGPHWRGTAPYYALLLVDERLFWTRLLQAWAGRGLVGGIPAQGAALIVAWPLAVGALPLKNTTVDAVVALGPFDGDQHFAAVLGVTVGTLQQWRSRARVKAVADRDREWVREHFPHWPDPRAVTTPGVERKVPV